MRGIRLSVYLALMLVVSRLCQGRGFGDLGEQLEQEGQGDRDLLALQILNSNRVPGSLQPRQLRPPSAQKSRVQRPGARAPKRNRTGSRFALSLDVPTGILSALIDLAKNREMRAKAAANAKLLARIGKRQ